jgi:hypothetical protein
LAEQAVLKGMPAGTREKIASQNCVIAGIAPRSGDLENKRGIVLELKLIPCSVVFRSAARADRHEMLRTTYPRNATGSLPGSCETDLNR